MKKILYVTNSPFPSDTAHGTRVDFLTKMLSNEYSVEIMCLKESTNNDINTDRRDELNRYYYGNVVNGKVSNIKNALTSYFKIINILNSIEKPDLIIFTGAYIRLYHPLKKYCDLNNVKLVFEICEWYGPEQYFNGKYSIVYLLNKFYREKIYLKLDGAIVISNLMYEYYINKMNNVIKIPPIVETKKINKEINTKNKYKQIVYAGFPGKNKDQLQEIIYVLSKEKYKNSVQLNIIGPTQDYISKLYENLEIQDNIIFHNKKPRDEVVEIISNSDFTIFLRENTLNSQAGFPTKFVESLSLGIPVISNLTSDIEEYLIDSYNGFIVKSLMEYDIERIIDRVVDTNDDKIRKMKENSYSTYKDSFTQEKFIKKYTDFIRNII